MTFTCKLGLHFRQSYSTLLSFLRRSLWYFCMTDRRSLVDTFWSVSLLVLNSAPAPKRSKAAMSRLRLSDARRTPSAIEQSSLLHISPGGYLLHSGGHDMLCSPPELDPRDHK